MQLSQRLIGADHMLVVGRAPGQTEQVGHQPAIDAVEALAATQTGVFWLRSARGDIESGAVHIVQVVEVAGFKIVLEKPVLQAAVEGTHLGPEPRSHHPESLRLAVAGRHSLGVG